MTSSTNEFQKWTPAENLGIGYDVDDIRWEREGIVFTLVPDGKERSGNAAFQLIWDHSDVISYHVTDETYRADCWGFDFDSDGRFFVSSDSEYLRQFRTKSPLFPENARHFLIVGTNAIVDVLAKGYPNVRNVAEPI